jgi:hypothetical protein
MPHHWQSSKTHLDLRVNFSFFFSFSWDDCISGYHLKKDLALMATCYWKTLKTVQNLAGKTCLKLLGTCLNLAKLLFGV